MANDYILSQLINENEKEVFKAMRDMRADMGTAKALHPVAEAQIQEGRRRVLSGKRFPAQLQRPPLPA